MKTFWTLMIMLAFGSRACSQCHYQPLVENILQSDQITTLLALEDLKDRASIRIIDKYGKLDSCKFLFKLSVDQDGIPLNVGVVNKLPMDLNTGYYRDLIISKLEKEEKSYKLDIYLSNLHCISKRKNRWHVLVQLNEKMEIVKLSAAEWN